jgi:hypothetical protein
MPISGLPAVAQPLVGLPGTGKRDGVREVLSRQMSASRVFQPIGAKTLATPYGPASQTSAAGHKSGGRIQNPREQNLGVCRR